MPAFWPFAWPSAFTRPEDCGAALATPGRTARSGDRHCVSCRCFLSASPAVPPSPPGAVLKPASGPSGGRPVSRTPGPPNPRPPADSGRPAPVGRSGSSGRRRFRHSGLPTRPAVPVRAETTAPAVVVPKEPPQALGEPIRSAVLVSRHRPIPSALLLADQRIPLPGHRLRLPPESPCSEPMAICLPSHRNGVSWSAA
jgi:hypothetical protein